MENLSENVLYISKRQITISIVFTIIIVIHLVKLLAYFHKKNLIHSATIFLFFPETSLDKSLNN